MATVTESVLYELDVFQVVFDDADQTTYTFLLLLQVLKGELQNTSDDKTEQLEPRNIWTAQKHTCLISLRRSASTL